MFIAESIEKSVKVNCLNSKYINSNLAEIYYKFSNALLELEKTGNKMQGGRIADNRKNYPCNYENRTKRNLQILQASFKFRYIFLYICEQ